MRKYSQYVALVGILLGYATLSSAQSYDDLFGKNGKSNTQSSTTPAKDNKKGKKGRTTAVDTSSVPQTSALLPNAPVNVVKGGSTLVEEQKASLRRDGAIVYDSGYLDNTPLEYEELNGKYAKPIARVWRDIDARDTVNQPFFYRTNYFDEGGNMRFIGLMLRAIKDHGVQAFSGDDDQFTTPITYEQALAGFGGGYDTSARYDMDGNVAGYEVRSKAVNPDSIFKFRIKEDWVFNRKNNQMYVRILGIAPVIPFKSSTGEVADNSDHPVFWIYYPDLRKDLVRTRVADPDHLGNTITWEQIFENRLFKSQINHSSKDAENGFYKEPLTSEQSDIMEKKLKAYASELQGGRR